MTNEELARAIQGGDKDKLLELWAAVRRFAHDRAYRWTMAVGGRAGLSVDDFEQVAFLALLEAWRAGMIGRVIPHMVRSKAQRGLF